MNLYCLLLSRFCVKDKFEITKDFKHLGTRQPRIAPLWALSGRPALCGCGWEYGCGFSAQLVKACRTSSFRSLSDDAFCPNHPQMFQ